jgi:hypothetical protein
MSDRQILRLVAWRLHRNRKWGYGYKAFLWVIVTISIIFSIYAVSQLSDKEKDNIMIFYLLLNGSK